ncbi:hypothetical protein RRG08_002602 [Elysia crispata]|uniref:Cystatin domain-containing protein n=1 Tax=Elysia crispata TaxID=231223 RepID=A0AAE1CSQ7_9GAST|nr:hypothetical protein RRG08_002602 [Elysia crispata]
MKSILALSASLALLFTVNASRMLEEPTEFSPNRSDPEVIFAMKCLKNFFTSQDDTANRTLVKVVHATKQTVQGTLYRYQFEISGGANGNEICDISVWNRPWLPDPSLRLELAEQITCDV